MVLVQALQDRFDEARLDESRLIVVLFERVDEPQLAVVAEEDVEQSLEPLRTK